MEAHEHSIADQAIESAETLAHDELPAHDEQRGARPARGAPGRAGAAQHHSEDEPTADISAELKAAEEATAEQVTAMLTGVLDRLGAAHHRPFSRG